MDPRQKLKKDAIRLREFRDKAKQLEAQVQGDIAFLFNHDGHGSAKKLATELGVSQAYLSDVRYRRRGVGDDTVNLLAELL